ncbi:MAG: diacylglycerol kinase family lipid kinase [Reichenbachiella sp.]
MTEKKKILFIVNPISGGKTLKNLEYEISQNLDLDTFDYSIYFTTGRGDAIKKASNSAKSNDIIVAVGGDGTINEIAQGLIGTQTALAIIPKGSGNGFSNYFNIPHNPSKAIKKLNGLKIKEIDTATFNHQLFLSVAGMGFDATVAHAFDTFGKRGFLSYAWLTLREFINFKPSTYQIEIDGNLIEEDAFLITAANSNQFGNKAYIAPNAVIDDGLLELVIIKPFRFWQAPSIVYHLFNGSIQNCKLCQNLQGHKITIKSSDLIAQIDGELTTAESINTIEISASSLKMVV